MVIIMHEDNNSCPPIEPGNYWATLEISGNVDTNAIIGYDEQMETFFCQGFENDEGEPLIWVGNCYRQCQTMESLEKELSKLNVRIVEWELGPLPDDLLLGDHLEWDQEEDIGNPGPRFRM